MWAVIAVDHAGPAPGAARQRLLADHLAHVQRIVDRIAVAGPLRDADGMITGSLLVLDVASEAEARALIAADPYAEAEIWARVDFHDFKGVAGNWVGGRNW